jgi:hypothetical protein
MTAEDARSRQDRRSGRLILLAFILAVAFAVGTVALVLASQHDDARPQITCRQTDDDQGCA